MSLDAASHCGDVLITNYYIYKAGVVYSVALNLDVKFNFAQRLCVLERETRFIGILLSVNCASRRFNTYSRV